MGNYMQYKLHAINHSSASAISVINTSLIPPSVESFMAGIFTAISR